MRVNINLLDNKGRTALDVAAEKNKNNVLITLLKAGGVSAQDAPHPNIVQAKEIIKNLHSIGQNNSSQVVSADVTTSPSVQKQSAIRG